MARDLSIRDRCDVCDADATHLQVPIGAGAAKYRKLDFCDLHYDQLIQPLLDVLSMQRPYPVRPPRGRPQWGGRKVGPFRCLAGCNAPPLKNRTTLSQHLKGVHGMTREEYVAEYGEPVPMTPEEQAELVVEVCCEIEGCGKVYSTALGNRWPHQAMRSHMSGHHGIKWSPSDA